MEGHEASLRTITVRYPARRRPPPSSSPAGHATSPKAELGTGADTFVFARPQPRHCDRGSSTRRRRAANIRTRPRESHGPPRSRLEYVPEVSRNSTLGRRHHVLVDILVAIVIVVVAAVLGLVVHPILWVIVIAALLWFVGRHRTRRRHLI